jgi:hypothetical protein
MFASSRFVLLSILIFCCGLSVKPETGKVVYAARFGAIPDDGKDDTRALQDAIAACRRQPGSTLLISPGQYQIKTEAAIQLEEDVLSGKMGKNPEKVIFTPYYPYSRGIDLKGLKDTTIDAEGAILLCEGWMEPISMESCTNILLKGITIDYKRKPFSTGKSWRYRKNLLMYSFLTNG